MKKSDISSTRVLSSPRSYYNDSDFRQKAARTIRSYNVVTQMANAELIQFEQKFHTKVLHILEDSTVEDKHTATAAVVFEVSPEEVTAAMRNRGKAINLGLAYHLPVSDLIRIAKGGV